MRKSYNPNVHDGRTMNCPEVTRRLYRSITEAAKRLDDQKGFALTITDLFTPSGEVLRSKLKDYCERLIFEDPVGHARKTEELLWRRAFYDTVFTAKKLRKGNAWNATEKALLSTHLAVGVGFYHHLILRLQLEYHLDLWGVIDFACPKQKINLVNAKAKTLHNKIPSDEVRQCAVRIIHRSLICLGDLARYNLDLEPNWDPAIAARYYKIAIVVEPKIGMPHNQLGTMAGNKNYGLDAVYHYTRCIMCEEPFEGAEGNLKRIINAHAHTGNETIALEKCVKKFLTLLQLWENNSSDSQRINRDCQDVLVELESCLTAKKHDSIDNNIDNADGIDVYLQNCKNEEITYLSNEMMFKIVVVCLMTIENLRIKESGEVQGAVAFTLTILSQLMETTINRLHEAFMEFALPNGNDETLGTKFLKNSNEKLTNETKIQDEKHTKTMKNLDNDCVDVNDNTEKLFNDEKFNNEIVGKKKSNRERSKSLLTKLRRPRKRLNSSDSEASEAEGLINESSSEELNSDISETDEDDDDDDDEVLTDGNAITDDGLSEDQTDDEIVNDGVVYDPKNRSNGHSATVDENDQTKPMDNDNSSTIDVEQSKIHDSIDVKNSKKCQIKNSSTANVANGFDNSDPPPNASSSLIQSKKQKLQPNDIIKILENEKSLQTIKISFDWLKCNPELFRMFAKSSKASLKRVVEILNLTMMDEKILSNFTDVDSAISSSLEKWKRSTRIVALPEDVDMRGFKILRDAHETVDWEFLRRTKMNKIEEIILRCLKMTNFGNYLTTINDSGVKFDETTNTFVTMEVENREIASNGDKIDNRDVDDERSRGKLMRHMGRLWLKAEVCALETRLRSRLISPYLVPDQEALAKHTPALKRLVYAKKFVVIIPSVVVSALDEMKRTSSKAREATRWLEGQLRKGSRFLRAQRPHERLALPLIKGPRTKDKEAWLFFQIIECCHYLTQQTKVGLNGDKEPPVVTLLTGFSVEERKTNSFSTDGLAKTAGVNLEHIETFHTKWKTSSKSHG